MRFIKFLVVTFLLAFTLVAPSSIFAANKDVTTAMTPQDYIEYLEGLSKSDQKVLGFLDRYKELSEKEKIAILDFMYSEDYVELLLAGKEIDTTVNVNGVALPVSVEVISDKAALSSSQIGIQATYRSEATARINISVLGLDVSQLYSKLIWQHNGTNALQVYQVTQGHSNYNPAVLITDAGAEPGEVSSGWGYGYSDFELRASASAGFLSHTVNHELRGKTISNKQHKMITNHPMGGFGWTNF